MIDKPIVFISCGQRTDAERQLGSDIGQLVSELTPFAPYFAEYQTSLGIVEARLPCLERITQQRHDYELSVFLNNHGTEALSKYQVDVEFPFDLLDQPRNNVTYVPERSSRSRGFFRVTQDAHRKPVFPGDTLTVISFEYFVDGHIFNDREELLRERVRATLYVPGNEPQVVEKSMEELQNF